MGCSSSSEASVYENGRPTFRGTKVTPGFSDRGNGLLFRIVNGPKKRWAYYNDSIEYEFRVTVTFNEDCEIEALGKTELTEMEDGSKVARVIVYPTETAEFIHGRVNGFTSKMDALPISDAGREFMESNREAMAELIAAEERKAKK